MNKKQKNSSSFTNVGLSSLMVVFLILCLTTFALLTLSTARSDYTLSEKMANHRTDYYQACSRAETILDRLDYELEYNRNELLSKEIFVVDNIPVSIDKELGVLSYFVPLENSQKLSVQIQLTDPSSADNFFEILSWQIQE